MRALPRLLRGNLDEKRQSVPPERVSYKVQEDTCETKAIGSDGMNLSGAAQLLYTPSGSRFERVKNVVFVSVAAVLTELREFGSFENCRGDLRISKTAQLTRSQSARTEAGMARGRALS